MKLILLKCGICHTWYRPDTNNSYHCSHCAAIPIRKGLTTEHYVRSETLGKLIPLVRGIPDIYTGLYKDAYKAMKIACVLSDDMRAPVLVKVQRRTINRFN